jgi:hypothetical protein
MSHGQEGSVRAILYALGANFGIAVEWMASANMEPDPVQAAAANFATAMPKFAPSA